MTTYFVIGFNDEDRWAASYTCKTPVEAEAAAIEEYGERITIAGVVALNSEGDMEVVA